MEDQFTVDNDFSDNAFLINDIKDELIEEPQELADEPLNLIPPPINTSTLVNTSTPVNIIHQRTYSLEEQRDYIHRLADLLDIDGKKEFLNIIRMANEEHVVSDAKDGSYINLSSLSASVMNTLYNYVKHKLVGDETK